MNPNGEEDDGDDEEEEEEERPAAKEQAPTDGHLRQDERQEAPRRAKDGSRGQASG